MKLIYPAIFYTEKTGGYSVEVPDLPGCFTQGDSLADAIEMATDAASGWILTSLEDNEPIPNSSKVEDIILESEGFVSLIVLDINSYAEKYGNKSVRKNLTIPAWLNTAAEKQNINFSQILQDALVEELGFEKH